MAPREDTSCGRLASARTVALRLARRAALAALLAPAILAAPAQALQLGPETPHSPNTDDMSTAYWVMIVIVIAIVVLVNAALVAGLMRFRDRRGRAPVRTGAGRRAITRIAVALSVPALAIFIFGIVVTNSRANGRRERPRRARRLGLAHGPGRRQGRLGVRDRRRRAGDRERGVRGR